MFLSRFLQYLFIAIVTMTVGVSLYQWNASRASVKLNVSQSSNLTSGLIGHWTFDGTDTNWTSSSAGTTNDTSGSGNTGTFTNMTQSGNIRSGKIGQGIYLENPDNEYVQAGILPDLSAAGSISVWFKGKSFSTSNQTIVSTANWDTNLYGFHLTARSNEGLTWQLGNASTYQNVVPVSGGGFSNNIWYHVVLTWDGSNVITYINGAKVNTTAQTVAPVTNFYALRIGENAAGASRRFIGTIDELRIYNRAISVGEVTALYQMSSIKENTSALEPQGVGNLNSALASYWKFDDGSGATTVDSSVNATYTGTLQGNTSWTTGQINGALSFDGTGDYVSASPVSTALPVTMCAWFKLGTTGTFNIVSLGDNTLGLNNYVDLRVTNTRLSVYLKAGGISTNKDSSTVASMVGSWHHGCGVYTASTIQVYLDGNANLAPVSHALVPTGIIETKIGRLSGSTAYDFNGQLDEVRIYNRALSADEISKLYQTTTPTGVDTSLKGYWSFDGNATNWTSSTTGTVTDLSGSNLTGTFTNMNQSTSVASGKIGQGLKFDGGATTTVTISSPPTTAFTAMTLSMWYKPGDASIRNRLFGGGDNTKRAPWLFTTDVGAGDPTKVDFEIGTATAVTDCETMSATGAIVTNRWVHIVGWWNGTTCQIYINGSASGSPDTTVSSTALVGTPWYIGRIPNLGTGPAATGVIDEVRFYDRALSVSEIVGLYQIGVKKINTTQDINTNGLVGHWTLDGKDTVWSSASAGTTLDTSGNGNTGTLTNMSRSTSPVSGKIGQALNFDGVDDEVRISDPVSGILDFGSAQDFSISVWVRPNSFTSGPFIVAKNINRWLIRFRSTGRIRSQIDDGVTGVISTDDGTGVALGRWSHVVVTFDRDGMMTRYVNGAQDGVADSISAVGDVSNASSFIIGDPTVYLNGRIDDVRIYNRVLSSDDVSALYTAGR